MNTVVFDVPYKICDGNIEAGGEHRNYVFHILRNFLGGQIMKLSKLLGAALGAMLALAMVVPAAHATELNQMTKITINAPFQIPGNKVLGAGTYWFKLMDNAGAARNILVIYNSTRSEAIATVMTRPTQRMHETSRTELQFATSSRRPLTLVRWFYPGRFTGHTFIYSPQRERRIHRENLQNVYVGTAPIAG